MTAGSILQGSATLIRCGMSVPQTSTDRWVMPPVEDEKNTLTGKPSTVIANPWFSSTAVASTAAFQNWP